MDYAGAIVRFLYEQAPTANVDPADRFEAVSAAVFGTKQRRYGPLPSPEDQVRVRDVIRAALADDVAVTVFVPWGSRKQADAAGLDVLELVALQQLRGLRDELARFGVAARFVFRVEDLTDRFLFGPGAAAADQIDAYRRGMFDLVAAVLGPASIRVVPESFAAAGDAFLEAAAAFERVFYRYLVGDDGPESLARIGWAGTIPPRQRRHYAELYQSLYPGQDVNRHTARYFAATLARGKLKATAAPDGPFVQAGFSHPVPDNPVDRPRVYYRTLPCRFTHAHRAPWLARGYLRVADDGECVARFRDDDRVEVVDHTETWAGVAIATPYAPA